MAYFDCTKCQNMSGLYFSCKNEKKLQIAYKWSTNEIVYVDYIHHPYVTCIHQGESSFATKHCIQLHLCN